MRIALAALSLFATGACAANQPVLPRPSFANSFCLFPIHEARHVGSPQSRDALRKVVEDMRATSAG